MERYQRRRPVTGERAIHSVKHGIMRERLRACSVTFQFKIAGDIRK